MEMNNYGKRMVKLRKLFEDAWKSVCVKSVELKTDESRTPFVARTLMAKRQGSPKS